jgi:hypothetical protein
MGRGSDRGTVPRYRTDPDRHFRAPARLRKVLFITARTNSHPRAETACGSRAGIWALTDSRLPTRRVALWARLARLDRTACRREIKSPGGGVRARGRGQVFAELEPDGGQTRDAQPGST